MTINPVFEDIARKFAKRIKWEQSHSIHDGGFDDNLFTNILGAIQESQETSETTRLKAEIFRLNRVIDELNEQAFPQ